MISLRRELEELHAEGMLPADRTKMLIAIEEREIVSVHALLRFLLWGGVALLVGGIAVWFAANLDQLGPAVVTVTGAIAAGLAYGGAVWIRTRSTGDRHSLAVEYLGLLGALLLSATVAWAEVQFDLLANWKHHLLILAAVHAGFAYLMNNRLVLAVAMTSLAAWFGLDQHEIFELYGADEGVRLLLAGATFLVWRLIQIRWPLPEFETVLEHGTVHLAFLGALLLIGDHQTEWIGFATLAVIAILVGSWIRRTRGKSLHVIWLAIYSLIGIDVLIVRTIHEDVLVFLWLVVSSLGAIFGLIAYFTKRREES